MLRAMLSTATLPLIYVGSVTYWVIAARLIGVRLRTLREHLQTGASRNPYRGR